MAASTRAYAADGRQLEDEPQPPRGRGPGAEAGLDARRTRSTTSPRSRSSCCRRSPTCAACRRSSTATGSRSGTAPRTSRSTTRAPTPARSARRCWRSSAARTSSSGHSERRAVPRRGRRAGQREGAQGVRGRDDPDRLRRRGARDPAGGRPRQPTRWPSSTGRWRGFSAEEVAAAGGRLRAGLGDRHRRGGDPGGRAGGLRGDPGTDRRSCTATRSALRSGSCTAARSRPPTSAGIMAKTDVDGCLVGGASLQVDEFGGICRFYDMPVDSDSCADRQVGFSS